MEFDDVKVEVGDDDDWSRRRGNASSRLSILERLMSTNWREKRAAGRR